MGSELLESWNRLLSDDEKRIGIIDTTNGEEVSFAKLQAMSDELIGCLPGSEAWAGRLWVLAVSDRVEWLSIFLSAIRLGAALMPIEGQKDEQLLEIACEQGAALLFSDSGIKEVGKGKSFEETFLIKLTSGTTGKPSALRFDEAAMCADGRQITGSMGIGPGDRNYAILPLGHSYGLGNLVMPFFMQGTSLILGSAPYPQVMFEEMHRWEATVLPLVPPLVKALSSVEVENPPGALRLVISAGSRLEPTHARRFHEVVGIPVHNFYGSSETGGICFDQSGRSSETDGSVGSPLSGVSVRVDGEGRILVESPAMCRDFSARGPLRLHDFGEIDSRGMLHLKGRDSDVVKIAGRRLALSEVEGILCRLPGVGDAYVSTRLRRNGEPRLCVLYSGGPEPEAIREALAAQLPEWKLPQRIYRVEGIAYTPRGKKDRASMEQKLDELRRRG